jgi:SAM-dependent methyltransferase
MTNNGPHKISTSHLPDPLDRDRYLELRGGIYDDETISVFVNEAEDFAFLDPAPTVTDYDNYLPRAEKLGLAGYKKQRAILEDRFSRITSPLVDGESFLEIGAADGGFLQLVHENMPDLRCYAIEPDSKTRAARDALSWLEHYNTAQSAIDAGCRASNIGMFHVFEHLVDPRPMLDSITQLLEPGGRLIIEVPCLLDPLLSVYKNDAYEAFYFQKQHPYIYSGNSIARVIEAAGYTVLEKIAYQRYGLENHLNWLQSGTPGGNPAYRDLFAGIDQDYRRALEASGKSDTIIVIAGITA